MTDNLKKTGPVVQPASSNNDKGKDSNASMKNKAKSKADDIVDSWENELLSSDEDEDDNGNMSTVRKRSPEPTVTATTSPSKSNTGSGANAPSNAACSPAPTPHTRSLNSNGGWSTPDHSLGGMDFSYSRSNAASSTHSSPGTPQKRPEKQTAVANRIIAGALGVRAQRTEEQKAYDRAVRDNERKRIAREREEEANRKLEAERAKNAIWEE